MDPRAIEDLFERNADMRLLEYRHADPNKPPKPSTRSNASFSAESIVASHDDLAVGTGPRMRVAVAAEPRAGVIPGAVVGVAIDVYNDGDAPAPEGLLLISLPIETEYRANTLRIDGREVQAPEALFAQGLPIARLPGATSSKVTFQLAILPGVNALYLQPRLQAAGVPVVGTSGVSIKRATGTMAAPPAMERPFYELEDDEPDEVALPGEAAIMPPLVVDHIVAPPTEPVAEPEPVAAAVAEPVMPEPVVAEPIVADVIPEPPVIPEPAVAVPAIAAAALAVPAVAAAALAEPAVAEAPAPLAAAPTGTPPETKPKPRARTRAKAPTEAAPAALPAAAADADVVAEAPAPKKKATAKAPLGASAVPEERMTRYRTLGANDIALLDRLFTPDVPGLIAHYVMISTIACSDPGDGSDASGYAAFLRRDIELLGRALVHSRMGKAPQYRIAQSDLDRLALTWDATAQSGADVRRLRRDLRKPEWAAIGGLMQASERDATLRTRIALLALAGERVEGLDRTAAAACTKALAAYRSSVLAWLVPLCVASAATTGSFEIPAPPPAVDVAGRQLAVTLKNAVTL